MPQLHSYTVVTTLTTASNNKLNLHTTNIIIGLQFAERSKTLDQSSVKTTNVKIPLIKGKKQGS